MKNQLKIKKTHENPERTHDNSVINKKDACKSKSK